MYTVLQHDPAQYFQGARRRSFLAARWIRNCGGVNMVQTIDLWIWYDLVQEVWRWRHLSPSTMASALPALWIYSGQLRPPTAVRCNEKISPAEQWDSQCSWLNSRLEHQQRWKIIRGTWVWVNERIGWCGVARGLGISRTRWGWMVVVRAGPYHWNSTSEEALPTGMKVAFSRTTNQRSHFKLT